MSLSWLCSAARSPGLALERRFKQQVKAIRSGPAEQAGAQGPEESGHTPPAPRRAIRSCLPDLSNGLLGEIVGSASGTHSGSAPGLRPLNDSGSSAVRGSEVRSRGTGRCSCCPSTQTLGSVAWFAFFYMKFFKLHQRREDVV